MCRDRAWRRYTEERIVIRRLNNKICTGRWYWRGFEDANGIKHKYPLLSDYIGSTDYFTFKTHTTKRYDTRYKTKYSPNKCKHPYRYKGGINTREESKLEFLKILKDNGIK